MTRRWTKEDQALLEVYPDTPVLDPTIARDGKLIAGGYAHSRKLEVKDVAKLARRHTAEAIDTLHAIMSDNDANPAVRVVAAEALLNRGWGKPKQAVDVSIDTTVMSDEELFGRAAVLLKKYGITK